MNLLLDTHAVLWLVEGSSRLGPNVRTAISLSPGAPQIAGITLLEISMLFGKGRLETTGNSQDFLRSIERHFPIVRLDAAVAHEAFQLDMPQADPFDRVIVATARLHGLTLATCDKQIVRSRLAPVLW